MLSYVACPALQYFSTLSHKRQDFREKHKMCFHFLYNFCLKHFSFYEESSERLPQTYVRLHVTYPLFLPDFNETRIFSTEFPQIV